MGVENVQTTDTAAEGQAQGNAGTQTEGQTAGDGQGAGGNAEPYKTFASKEEFDRHAAGILNSAKTKAEKELLSLLGLKPDEKDKLAKFKEAYDATLTETERQAKSLELLNSQVAELKSALAEKEALIIALGKTGGKSAEDVDKYVKMARGLVDDKTDINAALEQVMAMAGLAETQAKGVPKGSPLPDPNGGGGVQDNPFRSGNMTEQGKMIAADRNKAREAYFAVHGKNPSW